MDQYYFLQIFIIFLLTLSLVSGRALFYDKYKDLQSNISDTIDTNTDASYKNKQFHQRSLLNTSHSSHSQQHLIDILRQAYNQGWKPNLKHYIPATRFGRHR